jgi:hypothetical protein
MTWPTEAKDWADLIQSSVTIMAIIIGGYWTYRLYRQKRQRYPCANVEHQISHRLISPDKVLLHVNTGVTNAGEVLLSLRCSWTTVEQMLPIAQHLQAIIDQSGDPVEELETDIVWPLLAKREKHWQKRKFELEPNENDARHFDFILDSNIETVLVYTYFRNAQKYRSRLVRWLLRQKSEIGWGVTTIYDLKAHTQREDDMPEDNKALEKLAQAEALKQHEPRRIAATQQPKPVAEPPSNPPQAQQEPRRVAPSAPKALLPSKAKEGDKK